jgi:uncharacterized lipoprotein NlpE involved in copper resistance
MKTKQGLKAKIWMVAAIIGIISGCGGNAPKTDNLPDIEGIYIGNLPTADGMGMVVSITLDKETYIKKVEYVGKDGFFEDKGIYTFDKEDNTIVFEGITDSPNKYLVDGTCLIQLDMEGNRITGELADMYVLQK